MRESGLVSKIRVWSKIRCTAKGGENGIQTSTHPPGEGPQEKGCCGERPTPRLVIRTFGGAAGKSDGSTSRNRNSPPSNGVPVGPSSSACMCKPDAYV